ncbi:MAG: FmdB family transcriptional regulator [Acidobacteria bacterium]|nr:MAG: FmdB family transcriptional regulator [Acidobacteriota bacterium]
MPLYDFHCNECGHEFEALVRPQDPPAKCPSCQSATVEKLLSGFALHTEDRHRAAVADSRKRQIAKNKDKLVAEEEYRKEHEGH